MKFLPGKTRIKYGGAYTDKADFKAIKAILDANWWTIDKQGKLLEKELADYSSKKYAVLTNSGSSALLVAFRALGLPKGSEVITGAVQFPTAISSMFYNRLTPVYVDVDIKNLSLDTRLIEKAITKKTKVILAVAIAGNIPNIKELRRIAKKHNLILMLDNCDGFGGLYRDKPLEHWFDISATSFHAAHILCMGEGGAVFTNNKDWGIRAMSIREWGRLGGYDKIDAKLKVKGIPDDYPARYLFTEMGFNVKPLELQCALGRTQLKKIDKIRQMRLTNYQQLEVGLLDLPIVLPCIVDDGIPSWFGFPMLVDNRSGLREFLEKRNIETRTIFGGNITKQPAYRKFGRKVGKLDIADLVMNNGMFVSVHPNLTKAMISYIVKSIREFYGV